MKKKNGFTLIELLAVIIILGILMIIGIPAVTNYINNSRKSTYVDTIKEIISGARILVNEGRLNAYNTGVTYYIDQRCIKTENGQKSPYGEFDKAYVIVLFDGDSYKYFWTGLDETGQGMKKIIKYENLNENEIVSDIKADEIIETAGINGRSKYTVIDANCNMGEIFDATVFIDGETGDGFAMPDDLSVSFRAEWAGLELQVGDHAKVVAEITGGEGYVFTYQWHYSLDKEHWNDVTGLEDWLVSPNGRDVELEFIVNNENKNYWWNVDANIIGKKK